MNANEIYNFYPCVMTGRDINKEQGKYKKLPFIQFAGDLADNCYYRQTPTGYILYRCNGYLQPVYVQARNIRKYFPRCPEIYVKTVREWIEKNFINE